MTPTAPTDAYAPCHEGTKPHTAWDHNAAVWPHNPWSAACSKNGVGEPTCPRAYCPTCQRPGVTA